MSEDKCPCEETSRSNCTKCQDLPIWYFDKETEEYPFSNMSTNEVVDDGVLIKNLGRKLKDMRDVNRVLKTLVNRRGRVIKRLKRKNQELREDIESENQILEYEIYLNDEIFFATLQDFSDENQKLKKEVIDQNIESVGLNDSLKRLVEKWRVGVDCSKPFVQDIPDGFDENGLKFKRILVPVPEYIVRQDQTKRLCADELEKILKYNVTYNTTTYKLPCWTCKKTCKASCGYGYYCSSYEKALK